MFITPVFLPVAYLLTLIISGVDGHGYLKTPRARNIIAYQDGLDWGDDNDKYPKDYCPHCLNRGGTLGRCGNVPAAQNYDTPRSRAGTIMPADPQMVASIGSTITVDVGITAHHKGHFEFKACAVSSPAEAPSQECFDNNVLSLVADVFYGSQPDSNYPERCYIPPSSYSGLKYDGSAGPPGSLYRYTLQLPQDLVGDLVLLQWRYLTANSCTFPGYDTYNFPSDWGNMGSNLALCQNPLPADGDGVPEQFWNCAEMTITNNPVEPTTSPPIPAPTPLAPPVPYPTLAPVSAAPVSNPDPTESPIHMAPPVPNQPSPDVSCDDNTAMSVNVGYYQSWAVWRDDCSVVQPEDIDVAGMGYTHLLYSFAAISSSYTLEAYNQDYNGEYPQMVRMNSLKQTHPHLKTLIAVGGWSHNDPGQYCNRFSDASGTTARRETFANSVIAFLRQHGFDGVDLDWEYPGDLNRCGSGNDKQNYALLVQTIREKMDQAPENFLITMAVPVSRTRLGLGYDLSSLAQTLDFINLMSYDIAGSWGSETGSHTDMRHIRDVVKYFEEKNYPFNKLVLGLGAYGRTFSLTDPNCDSIECPFNGARGGGCPVWDERGYMAYLTIQELIKSGAYKRYEFNALTESMELVTNDNEFISFDDESTFAIKASYAAEQCLRGYMWWAVDMIEDSFTIGPPTPPTAPTPTAPVPAPVPSPISNNPCGGGDVGDGICADPTLCCSEWGWCGTTPDHCAGNPTQPPVQDPTLAPTPGPTLEPTPNPTEPPVPQPTEMPVADPTEMPVDNPTEPPVSLPGNCETIFLEDFEDGFGNFSNGKNDAKIVANEKKNGLNSVQLRDDSRSSKILTRFKLVRNFSELVVNFWMLGENMQAGEYFNFDIRRSGKNNKWENIQRFNAETDFANNVWLEKTVSFPTNGAKKVRIRFQNYGTTDQNRIYLDDITFCGLAVATPTATPTESPIFLAPPIPTPAPTIPPTPAPITLPTNLPTAGAPDNVEPCCAVGYTGLNAWNDCKQFYHCVNGAVTPATAPLISCPGGTLFSQDLQNCDWDYNVDCVIPSC